MSEVYAIRFLDALDGGCLLSAPRLAAPSTDCPTRRKVTGP